MTVQLVNPARSRILLVGTSAHLRTDERLPDVPAVANNIRDLAATFTDPELVGFDADHCVVASNAVGLNELGEFLADASEHAEELLLIYFAGHGLLDRRGQLHLALADTHPDRLGFTALPYETLRAVFLDSDAASKVLILDSCFSGRAVGQTLAYGEQQVLEQLAVNGTYTLTSVPANRSALIRPRERHSAFTGRLLELLRGGDPKAGPVLSLGEIYRHLRTRLKSEGLPEPQQRGTSTADQLGLVRNSCFQRNFAGRADEQTAKAADNVDERIAAASLVRAFGVQVIPGQLQCPRYLGAMVRTGSYQSREEMERELERRLRRQKMLDEEGAPFFWTVIDEAALRRPVGIEWLREQLDYLIEKADQPNIVVQLLPFSVGAHPEVATGSFTLLRFAEEGLSDAVLLERFARTQYIDRPGEVERYMRVMDQAACTALTPDDSIKALKQYAISSRRSQRSYDLAHGWRRWG